MQNPVTLCAVLKRKYVFIWNNIDCILYNSIESLAKICRTLSKIFGIVFETVLKIWKCYIEFVIIRNRILRCCTFTKNIAVCLQKGQYMYLRTRIQWNKRYLLHLFIGFLHFPTSSLLFHFSAPFLPLNVGFKRLDKILFFWKDFWYFASIRSQQ